MSGLPSRLAIPARLIFQAAGLAKVPAILFGGAAAKLNGSERETKDLDINVKSLDLRYKLDDTTFYTRSEGHAVNRLTTTYVAVPNDHVRCDIAARGNIEALLPYTKEFDGIRYASEPLLLADKIRTVGQRAAGNDAKRDTDLEDVMTMASEMERQGMKMPQELIDMYLTEEDIQRFWEAVPPVERGTFKLFLEFVGIPEM